MTLTTSPGHIDYSILSTVRQDACLVADDRPRLRACQPAQPLGESSRVSSGRWGYLCPKHRPGILASCPSPWYNSCARRA